MRSLTGDRNGSTRFTAKENKGVLGWGFETVLYLDCDDGYITVNMCQNSLNCMLKKNEFYFM